MCPAVPHVVALGFSPDEPLPTGIVAACASRQWSLVAISHPQPDDTVIAAAMCVFVTPSIIAQLGEALFRQLVGSSPCPWFLAWHPKRTTPRMLDLAHQLGIFSVRFTLGAIQENVGVPAAAPHRRLPSGAIQIGDTVFDPVTGDLQIGMASMRISGHQAQLMKLLLECDGGIVKHEEINQTLFQGQGTSTDLRMVIRNLRKKIGDTNPKQPRIESIRMQGYRYLAR